MRLLGSDAGKSHSCIIEGKRLRVYTLHNSKKVVTAD